jgi:ABC-type multidrug transport system fused ATPase/permease subunit
LMNYTCHRYSTCMFAIYLFWSWSLACQYYEFDGYPQRRYLQLYIYINSRCLVNPPPNYPLRSIIFAAYRVMKQLKQECFASALNRNCTYFDFTSTGKVTDIMHFHANVIIDFISDKFPTIVELVATVVAGLALSFYYAWDVALVALASTPVIVGLVYITTMFSLKATSLSNDALQRASAFAKEVLSNVRTVFSFNAGQRSLEKYTKKLEPALKTGTTAALMNGCQMGSTTFCAFAAVPLVLWYGGLCISRGSYNGKKLIFFSSFLLLLQFSCLKSNNIPYALLQVAISSRFSLLCSLWS